MSAKAVVQALEDSHLIRLFLDFVAFHRLSYQKHKKEISYKCFQATWLLPIAKATGYGRTQTQAYKNALKNLLQLLMEDPTYIEYFSDVLKNPKKAQREPSPPPKPTLKTEGQEPEEKQKSSYQSFSRAATKSRQEVQHSRINLNRSMSHKADPEIEQAKSKVKALEAKLSAILDQNKVLRQKVFNCYERPSLASDAKGEGKQLKKGVQQKSQKGLGVETTGKVSIPKLNLEVLPNYHKKSQKYLNDVLLAVYQQKHGAAKVC